MLNLRWPYNQLTFVLGKHIAQFLKEISVTYSRCIFDDSTSNSLHKGNQTCVEFKHYWLLSYDLQKDYN